MEKKNPTNKTNYKKKNKKSQNSNPHTKQKTHKQQPEIQSMFNNMVNYDCSILDLQCNLLIIYKGKVCKSPVLWNVSSPKRKLTALPKI